MDVWISGCIGVNRRLTKGQMNMQERYDRNVEIIKFTKEDSKRTETEIGSRFNISRSTVSRVITRHWDKHR